MATKKVKFNKGGIEKLPNNKPVRYEIETAGGNTNYTGVAKRGRVRDRLEEHLGAIPGASVRITQFGSISEAEKSEARIIRSRKPRYNNKGK